MQAKLVTRFTILAVFFLLALLCHVRHTKYLSAKKIDNIRADIMQSAEDLNLLRAEFSYLTRPARIQYLVNKYMGDKVRNISSQQVATNLLDKSQIQILAQK